VARLTRVLILVLLAVASGAAAAWWFRSAHAPPVMVVSEPDSAPAPKLGQFTPVDPPRPAPAVSFAARDGTMRQLADFRGRPVLVNLWATWCAPCVREMPSLDRLQARLGDRLTVLAISQDRGGAHVVDPFVEKLALPKLAIFLDPMDTVGPALEVRGLPTTLLIDGDGRIVAQLEGAAEWDSPAMVATVEGYLGKGAGG
jgi:thiol-disulfide isomerase/thioredoxin